jgi:putative tricarboxylic transport membrane protein
VAGRQARKGWNNVIRIRDPKNLICAALFVGLAALLAFNALLLPIGTAASMGPGYFPLALALILAGLGILLAVKSLRVEGSPVTDFDWRGLSLITLALAAFGASIGRLGFVPAVSLTVGTALLASPRFRLSRAIAVTTVLLAFCWAVFVLGLGLPVRLFGS